MKTFLARMRTVTIHAKMSQATVTGASLQNHKNIKRGETMSTLGACVDQVRTNVPLVHNTIM